VSVKHCSVLGHVTRWIHQLLHLLTHTQPHTHTHVSSNTDTRVIYSLWSLSITLLVTLGRRVPKTNLWKQLQQFVTDQVHFMALNQQCQNRRELNKIHLLTSSFLDSSSDPLRRCTQIVIKLTKLSQRMNNPRIHSDRHLHKSQIPLRYLVQTSFKPAPNQLA